MSWRDDESRDDARFGRPGGDWQGVRPSFDNPMSWAVRIGRVSGIQVRVHIFFLLFTLVELARALARSSNVDTAPLSFAWAAVMCGCFFFVVLVHEFGHCLACRSRGGSADEILMWPLGGLAYCRPGHEWRSHLVTAAGGPLVNVILCATITPVIGILTNQWWGVAIPNPLNLGSGWWEVNTSAALGTLYLLNWVSLVLLLFNLLPIFPLDGGRILQAVLWPTLGYGTSMRWSVRAGYIGAIALGVLGWITGSLTLVAIGVFGGLTCYVTMKQLQHTDEFLGFEADPVYADYGVEEEEAEPARPSIKDRLDARRETKRQALTEQENSELDRILDKIQTSGMDSLSSAEKRTLKRATDRRRVDDTD